LFYFYSRVGYVTACIVHDYTCIQCRIYKYQETYELHIIYVDCVCVYYSNDDDDDVTHGVDENPFVVRPNFFFFEIPNKRFVTVGSITTRCIFKSLTQKIKK